MATRLKYKPTIKEPSEYLRSLAAKQLRKGDPLAGRVLSEAEQAKRFAASSPKTKSR